MKSRPLKRHGDFARLSVVDRRALADTVTMAALRDRWLLILVSVEDKELKLSEISIMTEDKYAEYLRQPHVEDTAVHGPDLYHYLDLAHFDYPTGNINLQESCPLILNHSEQLEFLSSSDRFAVRQAIKVMDDTDLDIAFKLRPDENIETLQLLEISAIPRDRENDIFKQASEVLEDIS